MIHEVLIDLLGKDKDLFPPNINDEESIQSAYHCYRTFRRSSDTRATEHKVDILDIDVVNRWWSEARKRDGKKVTMSMRGHYCDFDKLLQPFLRYKKQM